MDGHHIHPQNRTATFSGIDAPLRQFTVKGGCFLFSGKERTHHDPLPVHLQPLLRRLPQTLRQMETSPGKKPHGTSKEKGLPTILQPAQQHCSAPIPKHAAPRLFPMNQVYIRIQKEPSQKRRLFSMLPHYKYWLNSTRSLCGPRMMKYRTPRSQKGKDSIP